MMKRIILACVLAGLGCEMVAGAPRQVGRPQAKKVAPAAKQVVAPVVPQKSEAEIRAEMEQRARLMAENQARQEAAKKAAAKKAEEAKPGFFKRHLGKIVALSTVAGLAALDQFGLPDAICPEVIKSYVGQKKALAALSWVKDKTIG